MSRRTSFELLKGACDRAERPRLVDMLADQPFVEIPAQSWLDAAQIIFDLRRRGLALKNSVDAVIAQLALDHGLEAVHDDGDFDLTATVRPLRLVRFGPKGST